MLTSEDPDAHAQIVQAALDKLQAQAERKLGELMPNTDLEQSARVDLDDAEKRLRSIQS